MRISDWSSDVCSSDLAVADLADDHQLVALLLVVGDRLAEAVEGLDGVELVIGLGVAVLVLLDLAVLDDRLRCDEGEADAALAVRTEAADVRGDASREKNLVRSEEHTSELQSLMRTSYAVFC